MSAPIPTRTLDSAKFAACANKLYETFVKHGGHVRRGNFEQICRGHGYNPKIMQAYFEAAGLFVDRISRKPSDQDFFVWRVE